MADKPYSRIYHRLMTEYPTVWRSPSQLGLWVQLLILAEKFYPDSAPPQHKTRAYRALVAAGLVLESDTGGYTIKGLEAERERRAESGRIGARKRWQSDGNAMAMLDETRIDKKETSNGQSPPTSMMRWPTKYQPALGEAARLVHDGTHQDADKCGVCHPLPREKVDA